MKRIFVLFLSASFALATISTKAEGLDLEQAKKLILQGKPADAFSLLEPYELEQAGNPKFDYLLGLAALNSGHADKASIILERVLVVDPLHAAARVDLGRAYYQLGDLERARAEFSRALTLNPPPSAVATIVQYMGAMEAPNRQQANRLSGYLEAGGGYNTNVNNATTQDQIYVPALLDTLFTLNPANVKTGDSYLGLAGGGEVVHTMSPKWSMYAGADLHVRNDVHYTNFNILSLDGRAGASFSEDSELVQGGLVAGEFDQGGVSLNRNYSGLNAEWRHTYNSFNQGVLFGQYLRYRYPNPALASNDFNQAVAGLGWLHVLAGGRASLFGSVFGGREQDTNLRIDGGKDLEGINLSGQASLRENLDLYASAGIQWGKYGITNSAFLVVRNDQLDNLTMGLMYRYAPKWVLRPQISLIRNESNIVVDRYDQADFSVTLRRDFD